MHARRHITRLFLGCLLAVASLLALPGCSMPAALSKTELDAAKLPEKHPKLSAEKEKAGCRSCHRELPAAEAPK
jgi:hypothetical protein